MEHQPEHQPKIRVTLAARERSELTNQPRDQLVVEVPEDKLNELHSHHYLLGGSCQYCETEVDPHLDASMLL